MKKMEPGVSGGRSGWVIVLAFLAMTGSLRAQNAAGQPHVILVMTDGLRWQEVFRGADASMMVSKSGHDEPGMKELREKYLAATAAERRERLMPFLWKTMIPRGQMYGDRDEHSDASVTNGFNFSYPGYSETLTGYGDPKIDSNDNVPNPNVTVLEWLNKQPGLQGKVAAFGAWNVIAGVVNAGRCGCTVNAGYDPFMMTPMTPRLELLNTLKAEIPQVWDDEPFDAPVFYTAMEYIKAKKPRVLFLSFGETDDWAHAKNYWSI